MTTKDAILGLAAKISESAVSNVATDAQALAELAKAMCGSAPTEPIATVDDAIAYITANYSGGGGGGVDVGAPTSVVKKNFAPEVGEYVPSASTIGGLAIGETVIVPVDPFNAIYAVASGMTATTKPDTELSPTSCDAYVVTVVNEEITAVEQWGGTLTPGTVTVQEGPQVSTCNVWTFTVPALVYDFETFTGQALYLYMH